VYGCLITDIYFQLIVDPDDVMPPSILDHRDQFVELAKEQFQEFSSMRRAKHSTLALFRLVLPYERVVIFCNNCQIELNTDEFR
jgi:hypothetical protein